MPGLMFDSDQISVLTGPDCEGCRVATYADIVTPELISALGGRLVVIHRGLGDPHNVATVADIEDGALTPEQGSSLIRQWIGESRPSPTAYHDRAQWAAVTQALAGVRYHTWVSTLDGTLLPNNERPDVVQFASADGVGFHADCSMVWNDSWHPLPASLPGAQRADLDHWLAGIVSNANAALGLIRTL